MVANQLPFFAVALVSKARLGHGKHTDLCQRLPENVRLPLRVNRVGLSVCRALPVYPN
jgi:hypothetical protein